MNTSGSRSEQNGIKIGVITGADHRNVVAVDGLVIVPVARRLDVRALRWLEIDLASRLSLLKKAIHMLCETGPDARLEWSFAPIMIGAAEAVSLLNRWRATREPPVLSLVTFCFYDTGSRVRRLNTIGLRFLVGVEIEAEYQVADEAAMMRTVARFGRHLLLEGLPATNVAFVGGPLGATARLMDEGKYDARPVILLTATERSELD